jgi:hypothetical protein
MTAYIWALQKVNTRLEHLYINAGGDGIRIHISLAVVDCKLYLLTYPTKVRVSLQMKLVAAMMLRTKYDGFMDYLLGTRRKVTSR